MPDQKQVLLDFVTRYGAAAGEEGPIRFVREVLGVEEVDPWQERVLRAFGRGERRISIRSCHGPGKTALTAWLIVYTLVVRYPQKTVATAPTRGQLFDALYAEVGKWFKRLPEAIQVLYHVKSDRIELLADPDNSFFSARTARRESPEAMQGVHCDPGYVFLIADEASGVDESIFEAAVGSMSGHNATTLLCGNPVRTSGLFFDTHHGLKDIWFTVHVSAADSERVTDDYVQDVIRRYGEDSNAYRVRVLGEFPKSDDDTVIPFELVEGALSRDIDPPRLVVPRVWGLDVARFGDDVSVLCERQAYSVNGLTTYKGLNLMELCGRVKRKWDTTPEIERPHEILVDTIGLGAGAADRLRELGLPVLDVNVSESASTEELYRNLRAELWFSAREWLAARNCRIDGPGKDLLARELVIPKYTYTSGGKIQLESKKEIKKRGFKSPNHADAFVMTFAGSAATLVYGAGSPVTWNQPLERNLRSVV